jgi:hypothetical protein
VGKQISKTEALQIEMERFLKSSKSESDYFDLFVQVVHTMRHGSAPSWSQVSQTIKSALENRTFPDHPAPPPPPRPRYFRDEKRIYPDERIWGNE